MNILICTPFGPAPHRIHPLTQQSIAALGIDAIGIETPTGTQHNMAELCRKHNEARQMVLDGGYDALLHIDADMVVPPDTVERLSTVDADVVYGLYVSRRDPWRWLCFLDKERATTLNEQPERITDGHITSYGAGLGCTLIHRRVLERLAFRYTNVASDWMMAVDCTNYGFKQVHDLGCRCGHIRGDRVFWPDATAPKLFRTQQL